MENHPDNQIYKQQFTVPPDAVDENGHVNNVMYVQWMQDIAVSHYTFIGGTALIQELGCTWVVREHKIEYLLPAFAGEEIEVQTWVADIRRVRSLRKYRFVRLADEQTLVRGETDWVLVDAETGHPHRIPPKAANIFRLKP
jgi:acyl-CoA thioester hydrolase